jgi:hypothetical protein
MTPIGKAALALGAAGTGLTIGRSMANGGQTVRKQQQLMAQRKADLSVPMFDPTIRVAQLIKESGFFSSAYNRVTDPMFFKNLGEEVGNKGPAALAGLGVGAVTALGGLAGKALMQKGKQHFIIGPEHQRAFDTAISGSPDLQKGYKENPGILEAAHGSLKKFAPSVATDPNAVRSYLSHALATNGAIDFATLKLLAETEKLHREGKSKGL